MKLPHIITKRHIHDWMIKIATVVFFCDLIAMIWPQFRHQWDNVAHGGVAIATFLAAFADCFFHEEEDKQ